ncbi:MAG: cytochrome c1 [Gammaproteobacteria bacterium]|nr:cytochrome c1 [Gammaproteobacteria bacterium]
MNRRSIILLVSLLVCSGNAIANESVALKKIELDQSPDTVRQGAHIAMQVCTLCHDLKYIKYSNLLQIGYSQEQVDALRGDRKMSDTIKASMAPAAQEHHFGMIPPDLSLMAKARKGGADYIYSLLTSYHAKEPGHIDNHAFPGLRMPDVLNYTVYTEPEERKQIEHKAQQVARFLEWAADPHADQRRQMGYYVMAYLLLLSFMLYLLKRKVWRNIH